MNKTASQIGDIVLQKLAVSPGLARAALLSRAVKTLPKSGPGISAGLDDLLRANPRAARRAYGSPAKGEALGNLPSGLKVAPGGVNIDPTAIPSGRRFTSTYTGVAGGADTPARVGARYKAIQG